MPRACRRLSQALLFLGLAPAVTLTGCSAKITAPPEPPVAVRLGDEAFAAQDYEGAIDDYNRYLAEVDRGDYVPHARYKAALAAYRLDDPAGTLTILDDLDSQYPSGSWVQVAALRGDALRKLSRPAEAVVAWDAGWRNANAIERPKLRSRVRSLARTMDHDALTLARSQVRSSDVAAILNAELESRTPPPIEEPVLSDSGETNTGSANLLEALRGIPVERGAAAHPGYDHRDGARRGPNRHPGWREAPSQDASTSIPLRQEEVVIIGNEAVEATEPEFPGLVKLDVSLDETAAPPPAAADARIDASAPSIDVQDDPIQRKQVVRLERLDGFGALPDEPSVEQVRTPEPPAMAPTAEHSAPARLQRIEAP